MTSKTIRKTANRQNLPQMSAEIRQEGDALSKEPSIKKTVLIDDSKATLLKHAEIIKSCLPNSEIVSFDSAHKAIEYLGDPKVAPPEIIFLDIVMPEMDGFQFLDKFVNLSNHTSDQVSPLILLVSENLSLTNFNLSIGYKSLGLNIDHLKKPMDQEDLSTLISKHFQ